MTSRQFSILGSLAAGDREVMVGHGAHADDLPPDDAGLLEIADRVRRHYGDMYGDAHAQWIELHIWEHDPPHASIREWHSERGTGTPAPHRPSEPPA